MENVNKFKQVFTFGFGQLHENCYTVIWGKDKADCRAKMFQEYGQKWSMQYNSEEEAGVGKFHLKEI